MWLGLKASQTHSRFCRVFERARSTLAKFDVGHHSVTSLAGSTFAKFHFGHFGVSAKTSPSRGKKTERKRSCPAHRALRPHGPAPWVSRASMSLSSLFTSSPPSHVEGSWSSAGCTTHSKKKKNTKTAETNPSGTKKGRVQGVLEDWVLGVPGSRSPGAQGFVFFGGVQGGFGFGQPERLGHSRTQLRWNLAKVKLAKVELG